MQTLQSRPLLTALDTQMMTRPLPQAGLLRRARQRKAVAEMCTPNLPTKLIPTKIV